MSTDSLDIKDLSICLPVSALLESVVSPTTHSSTCFQQCAHLTLGSDFITSQNNMIIMCSALQMT